MEYNLIPTQKEADIRLGQQIKAGNLQDLHSHLTD